MHYSEQQIRQARSTDMIDFLSARLSTSFQHTAGEYRSIDHDSLIVQADRKRWYWNSRHTGGIGGIDHLCKVEDMSFLDAMRELSTGEVKQCEISNAYSTDGEQPSSFLLLPEKADNNKRLWAYLSQTRGIHTDIIKHLLHQGTIYQDAHGNVVFLGIDENGEIRYAALRGTFSDVQFRRECAGSDKRYGFRFGDDTADTVYAFEAPIDAMSHATIALTKGEEWQKQCRLSLGGTADTALHEYLSTHPHVTIIVLCLDNDEAGHTASADMAGKYREMGYKVVRDCSIGKDFNDDILN